jgi:thiol-disulfide isomerase/thioredoxin
VRRIAVLAAVMMLAACSSHSGLPDNVAVVSERAPVVSGPLITGGRFDGSSDGGRVLVVNFFNPSCPPCRQEQRTLQSDWERLRARGVRFVGVHYVGGQWPASVPAARSYLRHEGVTYPVIEDPGSRLAGALGIQGIPSTVVIDTKGRIRFRVLGRVKPGELQRLLTGLRQTS